MAVGRGRPRKYDWETWFRSGQFVLTAGEDYTCTGQEMARQVRTQASNRGYRVRILVQDGKLSVLCCPKT